MKKLITACSLSALCLSLPVQSADYWHAFSSKNHIQDVAVRAKQGAYVSLDRTTFSQLLASENRIIELPLPNGDFTRFKLAPVQVMAPKLAAKYPAIQTYTGYEITNPANKGRFDFTPAGFHAMFSYGDKTIYLDPINTQKTNKYISYFKHDSEQANFNDTVKKVFEVPQMKMARKAELDNQPKAITTYRLAVAASGEYTQYHGGTVEDGMAAIVSLVNRLNQVFLTELAVQFQLAENNDQVVYTDASADPYGNNDDDIDVNTDNLNTVIGASNYDIGHIVTTGAGGLAYLSSLCTSFKGGGVTGLSNPTGDAYWIDYVAHELGHQFGAEHIFNGTSGSCGTRVSSSAYEPGGGNTIMGYAGICGQQNIANQGLDHYHSHSIDDMNDVISRRSCGTTQSATNNIPAVDAGLDYTIPAQTPFTLTGQASDIDNDTLTYEWQQFDLGAATNSRLDDQTDSGDGPLFRVFSPTAEPSRTFPAMTDVLADKVTYGETYPATNRALNFRFIVRDGQGGLNYDSATLDVVDTGQGFNVISPNGGEAWVEQAQTIEWNTAATELAPISCSHVDITLSKDDGQTFDTPILENTDNDGEQVITLPNMKTSQARIKISCVGNVFFNVSKANFNIDLNVIAITSQQPIEIAEDTALTVTHDLFTYEGGTPSSFVVAGGENYSVNGEIITPAENFFGTLSVDVQARINGDLTEPFTTTIIVTAVNDAPNAVNDSLTVNQDSAVTTVDVLANDSDAESTQITLADIEYSGSGSAEIVDGQIQYQPAAGFSGTDTVTYWVEDEEQARASAVLTITVNAPSTGGGNSGGGNSSSGSSGGGAVYGLLFLLIARLYVSARTRRVK